MSNRLLAGRYELIEKIGEGGMAIVYKGKDRLLNRYVAIKILRPEYNKDEAFIENFKKESQAAACLTHPNVVSVFDVGKEGNIHFIVMELVEGKTLSHIIDEKGRLEYKEAIEITRQVASALSLAHKNQIIHRDVKPHNILITDAGVAKLADFGIARAVSNATMVVGNNKVMGSVHYLSPEQARGSYIDERTDIYSLGIVLYEMLTGRVPFDGDNPVSIALMHINEQMTPPSQLVSGIPPQLERVVLKATDKYQSNRYKSADELIEELDNIDFLTKVVGNSVFLATEGREIVRDREPEQSRSTLDERSALEKELFKEYNKEYSREPYTGDKSSKKSTEGSSNGKNKKLIIIIAIVTAIVLGIGIFGLGTLLGWFNNSDEIEVPDLTGYTFEEAEAELEELGLTIEEGDSVYSADQEEGLITSQSPIAGSMVKEGRTIIVNISKGKKDGVVPNIVGQDYNDVVDNETLENYGFELGIVKEVTSDLPAGTIISQDPEAGSAASQGTKINVEVSDGKGDTMTTVPNLANKTIEEARNLLTAYGLTVGDLSYAESETVEKNKIISQSVDANSEVAEGTAISLVISKGVEEIEAEDTDSSSDSSDSGSSSGSAESSDSEEEDTGSTSSDGDDSSSDGEE